MTPSPEYFQKYLDSKFADLGTQIGELKCHVNDEIQLIRESVQDLQHKITRLYLWFAILAVLFLIHDLYKGDLFSFFKSFI